MQHLDTHDPLTGLWTRSTFDADLAQRVLQGRCTLLLCDLDYLKLINDSFGHLAGDQALRDVARALVDAQPVGWSIYRLGGDEFAVLSDEPLPEVLAWAHGVQLQLDRRAERPLKLSMGAAVYPPAELPDPPQELAPERLDAALLLFADADRRLYAAKRRGRGRVVGTDDDGGPEGSLPSSATRLLERDEASAQAVTALQRALELGGHSQLTVQSAPGLGLSAFLIRIHLVALSLGYQTLHISGDPYRACRQYGVWQGALLDGQPVPAPTPADLVAQLHPSRPLAVITDLPERFDPHTAAELAAQARTRDQARAP